MVTPGVASSCEVSEFADFLCGLSDRHPISSIEDGMHEEDWEGWKLLTSVE